MSLLGERLGEGSNPSLIDQQYPTVFDESIPDLLSTVSRLIADPW
jgi:hypothetical protein